MPAASAPPERRSARVAIKDLLRGRREPMKASDIVAAITADASVQLPGKTPAATISSVLTTEAKKDDGLWERTSTAHYKLRAATR